MCILARCSFAMLMAAVELGLARVSRIVVRGHVQDRVALEEIQRTCSFKSTGMTTCLARRASFSRVFNLTSMKLWPVIRILSLSTISRTGCMESRSAKTMEHLRGAGTSTGFLFESLNSWSKVSIWTGMPLIRTS